ncbi:MAG: hypothetical protein N2645_09405 [Clostridia bacterium]|nr:hypothetical protein [Clostridia bacterium]
MKLKRVFIPLVTLLLFSGLIACQKAQTNDNGNAQTETKPIEASKNTSAPSETDKSNSKKASAEIFTQMDGSVGAGILFDNNGNMFVCKNDELLKITPDGKSSVFCSLKALPKGQDYHFPSPLIWDMKIDKENNIIAAAQDRLLKITPEGKVTTLVREDFEGFVGASGLTLDKEGNMYVTSGNKILKYTPSLKKSVFIDGSMGDIPLSSAFSTAFDPDYKNLYVGDFDTNKIVKYPIDSKGVPGKPVVVKEGLQSGPISFAFGEKGNIYVSLDISTFLLKIAPSGSTELVSLGSGTNHMIAIGKKGFDEESIYFTTFDGKGVYKFNIGERAAARN